MAFSGFFPQTIDFFMGIRLDNSKGYLETRRTEYDKYVKTPFLELAEALGSTVRSIDPELDTRPARALSRIYRDTRFAKDKSPLRDHLWISFRPTGTTVSESLGFFFSLGVETIDYGFGYYDCSRERMDKLRSKLLARSGEFREIISDGILEDFQLAGDSYKRPLKKDVPPDIAPFYNLKSIAFVREEPTGKEVFSPELADVVAQRFLRSVPLYQYIKNT